MNQGSPFPALPLLLGSEHRAPGDILSPYLYLPVPAQQHRPQGGCKERLCFPSHPSSKASSPWVSTTGNAKELPTLSTTVAGVGSCVIKYSVIFGWVLVVAVSGQLLTSSSETQRVPQPPTKGSLLQAPSRAADLWWVILATPSSSSLSVLPDSNTHHLWRGGRSSATTSTHPEITEHLITQDPTPPATQHFC